MADASAHILVTGRVHGVGFRDFTLRCAHRLALCGRVRNLVDGRVEVDVEGDRPTLEMLVEDLRRGPRAASVSGVAVTWGPGCSRWSDFEIDY